MEKFAQQVCTRNCTDAFRAKYRTFRQGRVDREPDQLCVKAISYVKKRASAKQHDHVDGHEHQITPVVAYIQKLYLATQQCGCSAGSHRHSWQPMT